MISTEDRERLTTAQYRVVGNHSAVQICHWCKEALRGKGHCYKQDFYGIKSHRCLQMTPAVDCTQRCIHCWRNTSVFKTKWDGPIDPPERIIDGCIEAQRNLLSGFGSTAPRKLMEEALNPNQVAISLTGEPTFYPKIAELIKKFKERGFSTFLVTNGTFPTRIKQIMKDPPTNFYISLEAPTKSLYEKICRPQLPKDWENLHTSLKLMSQMKEMGSKTVIRLTLINKINNGNELIPGFATLIKKADPDFIEVKSYMHIGFSRKILSEGNMLPHEKVKEYAEALAEKSGYSIEGEKPISRVVLLGSPES